MRDLEHIIETARWLFQLILYACEHGFRLMTEKEEVELETLSLENKEEFAMEMDRRNFLKGSAFVGASAAFAGLAGCAPSSVPAPAESSELPTSGETSAPASSEPAADQGASSPSTWRTAPEPIADDQISATLDADLVVIGAGISGAIAATTAVQDGASVIILQKNAEPYCHGFSIGANGTRLQAANGISYDGWEIMNFLTLKSENMVKGEVVRNWVKYSGETLDWLCDQIEGVPDVGPISLEIPETADDEWNYTFTCTHPPKGGMLPIVKHLIASLDPSLADVHYSTPAVELRTDASGRVTGVVGKQEDGSYILCNGAKGVILCAGDYGNDREMVEEFLPFAKELPSGYSNQDNTGDGIKMGYWVGGHIDPAPHAASIHYDPGIKYPKYQGTIVPWLRVNANGERFSNEDAPYELLPLADVRQPGAMHFQVFDSNYETDWVDMGKGGAMRNVWPDLVAKALENGDLRTGETLEELAASMEVPAEAFVATVKRYNELCEKGYDEDFGKQAARMKKVEKGPFYAFARQGCFPGILTGLDVNGDMQVCAREGGIVEGLYAAGNCSGGFFGAPVQRMCLPGLSVGRALVTGRVAAKRALGSDY